MNVDKDPYRRRKISVASSRSDWNIAINPNSTKPKRDLGEVKPPEIKRPSPRRGCGACGGR